MTFLGDHRAVLAEDTLYGQHLADPERFRFDDQTANGTRLGTRPWTPPGSIHGTKPWSGERRRRVVTPAMESIGINSFNRA